MLQVGRFTLVIALLMPMAGCLNDPPGDVGMRWTYGDNGVEVFLGLCPGDVARVIVLAQADGEMGAGGDGTIYWRAVAADDIAGGSTTVNSTTASRGWTESVRFSSPPADLDLVLFVDTKNYDYGIGIPADARPTEMLLTDGGERQSPSDFEEASIGDCP
jgi:hypothetical protein